MIRMKSWPLSVLIAVGMASLISQLLSDTRAARFVDDYPLVSRGAETFKTRGQSRDCRRMIRCRTAAGTRASSQSH